MSLSLDEIRLLCTQAEYALVSESRTPAIEQLTSTQLKTNAANARKLVDKWQKLSRGQSRDESRATGEPHRNQILFLSNSKLMARRSFCTRRPGPAPVRRPGDAPRLLMGPQQRARPSRTGSADRRNRRQL